MAEPIPEGMTELYDADVPRVDLVGKGANGIPFLIAKQDGSAAGLLNADYVRSLITKAEPEPKPQETVTMTGSPAAIAEMIHAAAVRKAESAPAADVEKAEASTATMNDRPDSDFAYVEPGGEKDESGKTVPRSLRHFPIYDEAHVRNALSRAPQSPFGDKAMPKIRAAAKKFKIDVEKDMGAMEMDDDGMDPTVILAEPEMDAPGDPADPGSPAWEAIDAATARKWTALLARARSALEAMADRENLEAVTVDPDDAEHAMDLSDAACAIDYAISVLAPFAVDEQAEADCGTAEMEMLGKALGNFDTAPLETVEAFAPLTKAGRTLSSANEAALRAALQSLQQVLASLPKAPAASEPTEAGMPVTKTANEEPNMDTPTPTETVTAASGQEPAMGTAQAEPKPVAGQAVTEMTKADDVPAKKADKPEQMAIYDADGNLVGTVDPGDVTRLTSAKAPAATETGTDAGTDDGDGTPADNAAMAAADAGDDGTTPTDLAPAPAATVGTPADAVQADDDSNVAKATENTDTVPTTMLKSSDVQAMVKAALDDYSAGQADVVKGLEDQKRALEEQNQALTEALTKQAANYEERLAILENAPAVMAIASNGAIPPQHQMRGQDRGVTTDISQGALLKARFNASDDAREKKQLGDQMQEMAIARFQQMQQEARRG